MSRTTTNLNNFKKYKRAKLIVSDLENLMNILKTTKSSLKPFMKYIPAQELFTFIINTQSNLQLHLDKYKKIIDNKGGNNEKA